MADDRFTARSDEVSGQARSRPLPVATARDLLVSIEQLGVESGLITVDTVAARSVEEVGEVDQATLARPARRVVIGSVVGAAIGIGLGLIAMALWDLTPAPVILMSLIIGTSLGALWSLYGRLLANVDAPDMDTAGKSVIEVDTSALEPDLTRQVWELIRQAGTQATPLADPTGANQAERPR